MKNKCLTKEEFVALLRKKQAQVQLNQQDFAKLLGVSQSYLSDIYKGTRELKNEAVLAGLGLRRESHYVKIIS